MANPDDPLTLPSGLVLPNRIMKAAMSECLAGPRNEPDHRLRRLYGRWADGGFGLLITGNIVVDRLQLGEIGNVVIEDDRDLPALTAWADTTKRAGVPMLVQINHPGRQANPLKFGHTPVAPSAVPLTLPGSATPRALTHEEILDIIERFATAAAVCEKAGFEGVQIHSAHGYLATQFLSPLTNLRTDEWGGDSERRRRFLLEVVRAVRARVDRSFTVSVKLNSADFQRGGFSEEESREVVARLAAEDVDLIEISGGTYEAPAMAGSMSNDKPVSGSAPVSSSAQVSSSTREREAYFLEYARTVRAVAGDVPLAVTGGFRTYAGMSEAISSGGCDVVGIGRPAAIVPDAADAVLSGRTTTLPVGEIGLPMKNVLGKVLDVRTIDSALGIGWNEDQLHRMAAGKDPDLGRGVVATLASLVRRNGRIARSPRGGSTRKG